MAPRTAKAKKATDSSEATKKGRGKAKTVELEPEIDNGDIDEEVTAPVAPAEKKKRGKKAAETGNGMEVDDKEESAPQVKKGKKKVEEAPIEEELPESIEENSADDASANAEDDGSVDTNGDVEPVKVPSSRGRKKQPKKEPAKAEVKPGRGRKAKPESVPIDEEETVEEKPKSGRGRGRKAQPKVEEDVDEQEDEPKAKPGRGRKKVPAKPVKEKTPESDDVENAEEDDQPVGDAKRKEVKGRKGKKESAKEDSVEKEDATEEVPAAKKRKVNKKEEKGKGDSKDDEVEEEGTPEPKSKARRGQKKAAETTEEDADTESTNKRRRKPADDKAPSEDKKKAPPKNKASTDYETIDFSNKSKNPQGKEWNFKIACWNVDGIRAWMGKGGLDYLKYEKPDILCLQEVKCAKDKLPEELTNLPGYHAYWLCSEKDGYAGVGIYTTKLAINVQYGLQNEELDDEGRIITAEYEQFYLICTYVPNAGRKLVTLPKRLQWNEEFRKYVKELDKKKPVIICGDMNVSHQEIDLSNPKTNRKNAGFTEEERAGMTDLLGDGFVDTFRHLYPVKTGAYTFWTYMMNCRAKNVGWRLDYFIVSERLLPAVCDNVIRDQVYGSDHCPISLFLHLNGADKPKESL